MFLQWQRSWRMTHLEKQRLVWISVAVVEAGTYIDLFLASVADTSTGSQMLLAISPIVLL